MDIWQLIQQLESRQQQDPQAAEQLIALYEQVLAQLAPGENPNLDATISSKLGDAYCDRPFGNRVLNLIQAIVCYDDALSIWKPDMHNAQISSLKYARVQQSQGWAYYNYGILSTDDRDKALTQAITCYQEALRFWTPETYEYSEAYAKLGVVYRALSKDSSDDTNLIQATICYQKALDFWKPETWPNDYAAVQNNLGNTYRDLQKGDPIANLRQAITCFQEALRFWTPKHMPQGYALAQYNLGNAYYDLRTTNHIANLEQAVTCFQEVLRFWTPETDSFSYARVQYALGDAYRELSIKDYALNIAKAITCYQEALRFWTPETAPLDYATVQNSLGMVYSNLSMTATDLGQAIDLFREALRFLTSETSPREYARAQHNLAVTYLKLPGESEANVVKAIACCQEALRFWTAETSQDEYAAVQNTLGVAYLKLPGESEANVVNAITCFQEALRFWTAETSQNEYAMIQNNMGNLYSMLQDDRKANLAQAIICYHEALRFHTLEAAPREHRRASSNLADLYFEQQQWQTALDLYHVAMNAGELLYHIGLFEESKRAEMVENIHIYRNAAFASVRCGQITDAFIILERGKTRLLAEALRVHIRRPANVPYEAWAEFERVRTLLQQIQVEEVILPDHRRYQANSIIRFRKGEMFVLPGPGMLGIAQDHEARAKSAMATNSDLKLAIENIRNFAPEFLQSIDLPVIKSLLPNEHTAFISFCITDQGSMGFIASLTEQAIQIVEVPTFTRAKLRTLLFESDSIGEKANGAWIKNYHRFLKERTQNMQDAWQETITSTLATLGQQLLTPILSTLSPDIDHIIFLPSAELFLLPLHAVPLSDNDTDCVCDHYRVNYAPSIEVLTNIHARVMPEKTPELYAVINPQSDHQLVFSSIEGTAIAALFKQSDIDEGSSGTKQHVIAGIRGRTHVHFSCHATYDWNNPSASGLDLADNRLTLSELQRGEVDLSSARLVTLSACETGIVDVAKGSAEEYTGITAGFMVAGIPCVISSLWAVPDLSTAFMMERFYHNCVRIGMDFVAALREAQLWMRELSVGEVAKYIKQIYQQAQQKEKINLLKLMRYYQNQANQQPTWHPFAHPYYWAAFTVNGL